MAETTHIYSDLYQDIQKCMVNQVTGIYKKEKGEDTSVRKISDKVHQRRCITVIKGIANMLQK